MLKFKKVTVFGFPRCGNHYICALIALNFFDDLENYLHYWHGSHRPYQPTKLMENEAYIHINRNFDDVALSLFKIKERFGLVVNNVEELKDTKFCEMHKLKTTHVNYTNGLGETKEVYEASSFWKRVDITPRQYYTIYVDVWKKRKRDFPNNVYLARYERLLEDFQGEMLKIAEFLGSNKKEFVNLEYTIGWTAMEGG